MMRRSLSASGLYRIFPVCSYKCVKTFSYGGNEVMTSFLFLNPSPFLCRAGGGG